MLRKHSIPQTAWGIGIGFLACIGLYIYSVFLNHGLAYSYMFLNISLATIPLILSWRVVHVLKTKRWSAWEPLVLTLIWILFLPNSFYMVSDYIHLKEMSDTTLLYNAIMFSAFIFLAMFMGLVSLYEMHHELRKRIRHTTAALMIGLVIFGCCFAIYLGRDLRWNSWDLVVNPGGLLFDISSLILKPEVYPDMGRTIAGFFVLIGSMYIVSWQTARYLWLRGVDDMANHIRKQRHS